MWNAAHGLIVAMIEYRGSECEPFPAQLLDVKRAIEYVRAHASEVHGDPDQLILWGGSSGGHLAALTAVSEAAGVTFYDMTDALEPECFYDTGHLDYDYGAVVFTEVLDQWLLS